jgi:hypothetical protein
MHGLYAQNGGLANPQLLATFKLKLDEINESFINELCVLN